MTGQKKFAKYANDLKSALDLLKEQSEKSHKKAITILTKMRTHALKLSGVVVDSKTGVETEIEKKPKARSEYQNFQQKASNRDLAKRQIEARGEVPTPTLMMKEIAIMWKESGLSKSPAGSKAAAKPKPKAKPKKTASSSSIGSKTGKGAKAASVTSEKPKAKKAKKA